MASGIYKIEHVDSGRCYVGSAVELAQRWRQHRFHLGRSDHHNEKLQRAYQKYGRESLKFSVLELISDPSELIKREQHWMNQLSCVKTGYNLAPTAGSRLGLLGLIYKRHSEQERIAKAIRQTGKKRGPYKPCEPRSMEVRARMSAAAKGRKKSPEHVEKIAAAHRGLKHSPEQNAAKSARQIGKTKRPYMTKRRLASLGLVAI